MLRRHMRRWAASLGQFHSADPALLVRRAILVARIEVLRPLAASGGTSPRASLALYCCRVRSEVCCRCINADTGNRGTRCSGLPVSRARSCMRRSRRRITCRSLPIGSASTCARTANAPKIRHLLCCSLTRRPWVYRSGCYFEHWARGWTSAPRHLRLRHDLAAALLDPQFAAR